MDTGRGFEEALFPTLISTDFLQDLPKFCSGDAPKRVKTFERPFTRVPKIRFPLPHPPHGSPKSSTISPKNFQYFLAPPISGTFISRGTNIRCASKHRPGHKTARECTANSMVNPVVDPAMDSVVHLRRIWRRIPSARLASTFKQPTKICRAKQLQARMHVDANIHSWEYNKPACQTLIFLSVQISTQL